MPLVPNFTASQFSGTPSVLTLTDTSTGSDVTIAKRRIYLLQANGTMLVPAGTLTTYICLLYTSPSPRDRQKTRMPSSA